MKTYSQALILLSLIFSIITILFVTISTLLVYSLLMISMETKNFDNAVMRLAGLSKYKITGIILLQSCFFVLPSILLALIAIAPTLFGITKAMGLENAPIVPSAGAVMYAIFLGLLIPAISSIIPIKKALQQSIVNALSPNNRAKQNKGSIVKVISNLDRNFAPLVTFGLLTVCYGAAVFYGLPFGLISGSFTILLWILFMILLSLILGLTLIAYNF